MSTHWQLQEAKQRFSEVVRAAESGDPQIITRHGQEVAVVIDINAFHRPHGQELTIMDYLRMSPVADDDFAPTRQDDLPRDVDLTE